MRFTRPFRWATFLSVTVLTAACGDTPAEPIAESMPDPVAAFSYANGPSEAGPHVVRYANRTYLYFSFLDTPTGTPWAVYVGFDTEDLLDAQVCGGSEEPAIFAIQEISREERTKVTRLMNNTTLHGWDLGTTFPNCASWTAFGNGTYISNDNDLFIQSNNNVWSFKLTGQMRDETTGQHYQVLYDYKYRIEKDGTFTVRKAVAQIR